jgi:hypothetical protein
LLNARPDDALTPDSGRAVVDHLGVRTFERDDECRIALLKRRYTPDESLARQRSPVRPLRQVHEVADKSSPARREPVTFSLGAVRKT